MENILTLFRLCAVGGIGYYFCTDAKKTINYLIVCYCYFAGAFESKY
jgi:hypothetical protein